MSYSYKDIEQKGQSEFFCCEDFPTDTLVRIDDDYFMRSGYLEMHDIPFELPPLITYGSQEDRRNYNITKQIKKYFAKRYFYFTLFDSGIQLDTESWYSVIAEPISLYLCGRLQQYGVRTLLEPFCGVGGVAVHAAGLFQQLVVNDIDPQKIRMLKNNLSVYGKGLNQLTIRNKDALKLKPFEVDAVLICPPWGGIDISEYSYRQLDEIMVPKLSDILNHFKQFSKNMVLQMPKNTNLRNLLKVINMCYLSPLLKIEKVLVDGRMSQLFIYIGDLSFTAINREVMGQINADTGSPCKNFKEFKKNLKANLAQQNFEIFEAVYRNYSGKLNKHIFFDND